MDCTPQLQMVDLYPLPWTLLQCMFPIALQAIAAEARKQELQEELTATYKKNSGLAEDLMAAQRRLQIVRESNEAQVSAALLAISQQNGQSAGLRASR